MEKSQWENPWANQCVNHADEDNYGEEGTTTLT